MPNKGVPIKPEELAEFRLTQIPAPVIDCWNELIAKYWSEGQAVIKQDDAIDLIANRLETNPQAIHDQHWLDIEAIFEAAGWDVYYDKPGYNETYPARFIFIPKKTKS